MIGIMFFFFQAEDGIRDLTVTGVQTCALPISCAAAADAGCGGSSTMTHCTIVDLLAFKENEASAWARQHVETCLACRAELEVLYQRIAALKALPVRRPARDRWPAVRAALRVEERRQRRRWGAWSLSAAAGVATLGSGGDNAGRPSQAQL